MKRTITLLTAGSVVLSTNSKAVLGVGDIVSDPIVEQATVQKNIFDQLKYAWEQAQWAEKLATLHNTLTTIRENLEIAIRVKNAIGDPSQIVGLLDETLLDGALSESGIVQTLQELGGLVVEGGTIGAQLQNLLGTPINLNAWMSAGRSGGFRALTYNSDPLAKYRAVEYAYQRYNMQLQIGSARAQQMRAQIRALQGRLSTATTDAETQKIQGSLMSADAALQDLEGSIRLSSDQIEVARTLAVNRRDQESEAYNATVNQMNQETEANLELPVEEIATVTPISRFTPMKSTIALIIALVSLTLTSGNIIYSLSIQKRDSELEKLALAFFKEEEAKRAYYNRVQQDNRNAEAALDIPMLPTDVPLNFPPTGQKSK